MLARPPCGLAAFVLSAWMCQATPLPDDIGCIDEALMLQVRAVKTNQSQAHSLTLGQTPSPTPTAAPTSAPGPPDFGYKGYPNQQAVVKETVTYVNHAVKIYKDPSYKNIGALLQSIALTVALFVPFPYGMIVGAGFALVGGVVAAFEPEPAKPKPIGEVIGELVNAMESGFKAVDAKLDKILGEQREIKFELAKIGGKVQQIVDLLGGGLLEIKDMNRNYEDFMQFVAAAGDVAPSKVESKLNFFLLNYGSTPAGQGSLSKHNLYTLLDNALGDEDPPVENFRKAVNLYRQVAATRWELYQMEFMSCTIKENRAVSNLTLYYTERLDQDLKDYAEVLTTVSQSTFKRQHLTSWGKWTLKDLANSSTLPDLLVDLSHSERFCLQVKGDPTQHAYVEMAPGCDSYEQRWEADDLGRLHAPFPYAHWCLDYFQNEGIAGLWHCHRGMNQRWYFWGSFLRTKATSAKMCLTREGNSLKVSQCKLQTNQAWDQTVFKPGVPRGRGLIQNEDLRPEELKCIRVEGGWKVLWESCNTRKFDQFFYVSSDLRLRGLQYPWWCWDGTSMTKCAKSPEWKLEDGLDTSSVTWLLPWKRKNPRSVPLGL